MERKNIHKSISQLFSGQYRFIVPLYQRNFAWTDVEITRLIQDIYESFLPPASPYFVGTIVYIRRPHECGVPEILEIIDGQQRLTVLTLLVRLLSTCGEVMLDYDSRETVSTFLKELYATDDVDKIKDYSVADGTDEDAANVVELFVSALKTLLDCPIDADKEDNSPRLKDFLKGESGEDFINYLNNDVKFILAEMPDDTDVATYFEIMNNSGEQLRAHEIVKSLILGNPDDDMTEHQRKCFSKIWDACSQMDIRIEKAIPASERSILFGDSYKSFLPENIEKLSVEEDREESLSILSIISNKDVAKEFDRREAAKKKEQDDNLENKGDSIIDFPNFIMHVLRLKYNDKYQQRLDDNNADIPLNDKDLQNVYKVVRNDIRGMEFIKHLLYYRIILDRYVVRTDDGNTGSRWLLQVPNKTKNSNGIWFSPTFKNGDKIIKALSMLQVSFPSRKYKRFLQSILSWFSYPNIRYDANWYLPKLNKWILDYFEEIKGAQDNLMKSGISTPRFLLNFIDYLMYSDSPDNRNFNFRYYNSIEHHRPQSSENYTRYTRDVIDSIGNLFLVSKRVNSSLNDNDPLTKANKVTGTNQELLPNRKLIYERTITRKQWEDEDILEHEEEISQLLGRYKELLQVNELEEGNLLYRAMLAAEDYCSWTGKSAGGDKYNFTDITGDSALKAKLEVTKWLNQNLGKSLEDYIEYQLENNSKLKEDSWRWTFVKYPSITEFCSEGNFAWVSDGLIIYLLPQGRICNDAREMRSHLLFRELKSRGIITRIDRYGVLISLNDTAFGRKYPKADLTLHIWVNEKADYWCYEVFSGRNGNAMENIELHRNGWERNTEKNLYLTERPYLCECPQSYPDSINLAFNGLNEIIDIFEAIE